MSQTIKLKRGLSTAIEPITLVEGEPAICTDNGDFYVGTTTGKVKVNKVDSVNGQTGTVSITTVTGNSGTATKLSTARTISTTGDATGSTTFDGSANVSMGLTLSNSGVTAGTYPKVTVDSKGRVTAGTSLSATDIPALTLSKISDVGTVASKNTGTASGNIPILDASGKLDTTILPALALTSSNVVASQTAMLALIAEVGDLAIRTDINKTFVLKTTGASTLANWQELLTPTDSVTSVAGKTGVVSLAKGDVGLGSVDNTADNTKNVLTATKLTTARNILLSGIVTGTTSFDGSGNVTIATTFGTSVEIDGGTF